LAIYAAITGVGCGGFLATTDQPSKHATDWQVPVAYVVTAILLLPAACLLFTQQRAALRAAQFLLLVGGVGVASEAALVYVDIEHPGGAVGKSLVNAPAILIALLILGVVLFAFVRLTLLLMSRNGVNGEQAEPEPGAADSPGS
jgi:hypothetical protein